MNHFVPRRWLSNGHLMTLYAWAKRRRFPHLPAPAARYFDSEPGTRVRADCYWQPERARHPLLIALHGLEGSSAAHYMQGLAAKGFARGFNVILLNQRNCGGTESLCAGLYHSGLTHDAAHVIGEVTAGDGIAQIVVAGYSLGGNLALKLAGDYGTGAPPQLRAVCAISPVLELGRCVDALERPSNIVYQLNFVRGLRARMRRKHLTHPGRFALDRLKGVWTVRQFDEAYTAPAFGFADATDYYHRASAMRVVDRIAIPALIVTAKDDPFVPVEPFEDPRLTANPNITLKVTAHGGHCAYVASPSSESDGYWAEDQVIAFAEAHTRQG